jgi:hypothetical protein
MQVARMHLKMSNGLLRVWLRRSESFKDNRVRPLTVQLDLSIRASNNSRHALASRVELAYI